MKEKEKWIQEVEKEGKERIVIGGKVEKAEAKQGKIAEEGDSAGTREKKTKKYKKKK